MRSDRHSPLGMRSSSSPLRQTPLLRRHAHRRTLPRCGPSRWRASTADGVAGQHRRSSRQQSRRGHDPLHRLHCRRTGDRSECCASLEEDDARNGRQQRVRRPGRRGSGSLAANIGAWSTFHFQGQSCITATRHIVMREVAAAYTAALVDLAKSIRVGDPAAEPVGLGPIISEAQRDRAQGFLEASIDAGAVLAGRRNLRGALLPADGSHRRHCRDAGVHGGTVRTHSADHHCRLGGRGARARQRHGLRACGRRLHGRHVGGALPLPSAYGRA